MINKLSAYLIIATVVLNISSCKKNDDEPEQQPTPVVKTTVGLIQPVHHYQYDTDPQGVFSNGEVTLGRVLFYDKRLSSNNTVACASCHKQALGFGDNTNISLGVDHARGTRNVIPIQNLTNFFDVNATLNLFWDGRESDLLKMVSEPIVNHSEMGMTDLKTVADKLNSFPEYKQLVADAYYNQQTLDELSIAHSLTAFIVNIKSNNAIVRQENQSSAFDTYQQHAGKTLFFSKYNCGSCHQQVAEFAPTDGSYHAPTTGTGSATNFVNIGLDRVYGDQGRGTFTNNPEDNGKFRIPDLHNVAVSAPYMHDGRFTTLDQVLEHYSSGIADHPNLDPQLRDSVTLLPRKMNISPGERLQLIAFLKTLTDSTMLNDPRFSNPFSE